MVRCYLCDAQCATGGGVFVCEHCGCCCHQHCIENYEADTCPKCVDDPVIGAHEL